MRACRTRREVHMVDLFDRILDKGIVIDVWARVVLAGLDLGLTWEARIVVASIETYLKYAKPIGFLDSVAGRIGRPNPAVNPG
jgi:hypothetical protein